MVHLPRGRISIPLSILLKILLKMPFIKIKNGSYSRQFEKLLASFLSVRHCIAMPTCRVAFYYVLKSLKLSPGDEVLLTPLTIPDIVNAVRILGLKPVFVDLSVESQSVDVKDISKKISPKTKVMLLTYLSGIVPDMGSIMEEVKKYDLVLIEDISQSYGASYKGKLLGTFGTASIGSFSTAKTIATLLGGCILTSDEGIFENARSFSSEELNPPSRKILTDVLIQQIKISLATSRVIFSCLTYYLFRIAAALSEDSFFAFKKFSLKEIEKLRYYENYPVLRDRFPAEAMVWFSDLQAEIAIKTFHRLEANISSRRRLFDILCKNLDKKVLETMPRCLFDTDQNVYWHVPLMLKSKAEVRDFQKRLLEAGFDITGFAIRLCSEDSVFKMYSCLTPNASLIKGNSIFLPIHESFTEKEIKELASAVNDYFRTNTKREVVYEKL